MDSQIQSLQYIYLETGKELLTSIQKWRSVTSLPAGDALREYIISHPIAQSLQWPAPTKQKPWLYALLSNSVLVILRDGVSFADQALLDRRAVLAPHEWPSLLYH